MDLFSIFTVWLTLFSIAFTFLPLVLVKDWARRGTADGFSSVGLVMPMLMMSCWFLHGYITGDKVNLYLNLVNLVIYLLYIGAFAYYQPKRQYLFGQLLTLVITLYCVFTYVNSFPEQEKGDKMAVVAAGTQLVGMIGGIYDCARAIKLGHTEYIPASIQYGIFVLVLQWTYFAYAIGNYYMMFANIAGLSLNIFTISLYFFIPPLTWKVPLIGTGPQEKKKA
uniref:Sugar transporter SWEET n=1 Tax=Acrobeloides nanus TaxID=290746 RepID=A0A914CPS8_9BILA